ncbi:SpoIIE family protein phosphatase [Streptomyces sp. TRM43335]|uniref:protein-serine/threonine phosphatase n=1 Tax=Streptomyces taklimakanensis TaxID=2569853 RepID=A0A6G2B7A2_9ACTN|nr:SpoIIE family protein phosphatase [Streptomyces taklimakanensis]MTE18006.1 SpoIIE family protein phosphatase [Streptomyces taklimakanensis]
MSAPDRAQEPGVLRAIFEDVGSGVFATDATGRLIAVNPRGERIVARPAAGMLGHDLHDLLHRTADGDPVPREECRMLRTLRDGHPREGGDEYLLRGDGTTVPIIWAASGLRLPGEPPGLVFTFHDFSVRRAAERQTAAHLAVLESLTRRLTLVTEISSVLISCLDVSRALRETSRLLVPELADWTAVDVYAGHDRDGARRIAVHGRDGTGAVEAVDLEGPLPPLPRESGSFLARALRGTGPVRLTADDLARVPDSPLVAAYRNLFERLGGRSAVVVPLHSRRQVFGALTVARTGEARPFGEDETAVLADIGRRAGLAMDNARLFDQQRHVAETMQRQLLTPLPQTDHLRMAARYRPAQVAAEIGGDWYDAFLLADGATTMIIGDVVGHDLRAAAHMAEVRNMLRALAWDRQEPPSLIMRRLDEAMTNTSDAPMATVVFARIEGAEGGPWRLHWVNAGHPPPLLVTRDGEVRWLESGHGPLLGMSSTLHLGTHWPDAHEELPPESTVLFYTDGLVESRDRPIDTGMDLLARHATALARHDLEDFCDELLERIDPRGDDVALLAMRLPPYGAGSPGDHTPPPGGRSAHNPADPSRSAPGAEALDADEVFTEAPHGSERPPLP